MSEAELSRYFELYDIQRTRTIAKAHAAAVLRSCGRLLLPDQMAQLLRKYPDQMTKSNVAEAMQESVNGEPKEKNLLTALQAFDGKEQNDLSRAEIFSMLCSMNEKITAPDLEMILKGLAFDKNDRVSIDELFKWMTRPVSSLAQSEARTFLSSMSMAAAPVSAVDDSA
jgi:Ca2+-binding EF-hand superfamily protein